MLVVTDLEQRGVGFESLTKKDRNRQRGGQTDLPCGRKPKQEEKQVREIKALLRDPDIQVSEVARRYGISRTTLYKHVGVIQSREKTGQK